MDSLTWLEDIIRDEIYNVTGRNIIDSTQHLLSDKSQIIAVDFLYVFEHLEKRLNRSLCHILEQYDYTVFTISNLAKAIQDSSIK